MNLTMAKLEFLGRAPLIGLLRAYRFAISPAIGNVCRFEPSCSVYAEQAIQRFGVFEGSYLVLCRLLRCHPFARGGLDPVPHATPSRDRFTEEK
jgi:putative membrane protein insertion efficiency factor